MAEVPINVDFIVEANSITTKDTIPIKKCFIKPQRKII
jgi:hypothetical protein